MTQQNIKNVIKNILINFSAVFFFLQLVIKSSDPYPDSLKKPDPDSVNPDTGFSNINIPTTSKEKSKNVF
jgi:hypothetical protein